MRQPTGRFFTIGTSLLWTLSLAAACGKALPTSPTPSAATTNIVSAAAAATISGGISGSGGGLSLQSVPYATSGITVSVVGTSISSTVDGNGRFRLLNVAPGSVQLQFSGSGVNATVTVGTVTAGDTIEITVALKGTTAEIEDSDRRHEDEREIEGIVTSVAAGSFVVSGKTVTVTPTTTFKLNGHTGLASDVVAGARVHVKGTATATGVTATDVFIQIAANAPVPGTGNGNGNGNGNGDHDGDDDGDDDDANEFEATGTVAALAGSCPSIRFTMNGTSLATSASTQFVLACSSVANGTRVEVKGTRRADGSVAVTRVKRP